MADEDLYLRRITDRWKGDPAEELCRKILRYMHERSLAELSMLTFADLIAAADIKQVDDQFMRALSIMVSSIDALHTKYMLIDDNGEEFEIEDEIIANAQRNGVLFHPDTGQAVKDYERKLFPFFTASTLYLRNRGTY